MDDFWRFSLRVYGQTGVEAVCLGLQERHGLDVNLLLFACWLGTRGTRLTAARHRLVEARVGRWRERAILPLRVLRADLKEWLQHVEEPGGPPLDAVHTLRERVKEDELRAEKIEQQILAAAAADWPGEEAPGQQLARANLTEIHAFDDEPEALVTLLKAAGGSPAARPTGAGSGSS